MPKKSRRQKALQSKRREERQHFPTPAARQEIVTQKHKPVPSTPSASTPVPRATLRTAQYLYMVPELKRIGILAGIMLAILIVLALVLS